MNAAVPLQLSATDVDAGTELHVIVTAPVFETRVGVVVQTHAAVVTEPVVPSLNVPATVSFAVSAVLVPIPIFPPLP